MAGCERFADDLLPSRAGVEDGPSAESLRHLRECAACRRTFAERESAAAHLRALSRWKAPQAPQSALAFAAVMERLDEERLDERLAAEEPRVRRWLAAAGRLCAPPWLRSPVPVRRLSVLPARVAALAAAAALVLALALPALLASRGRNALAAEAAALDDRDPIPIRGVEYLAPGSIELDRLLPPAPAAPRRRGGP